MGITVGVGQSLEDQDVLATTTASLAGSAEYDSGFINVENFKKLVGMVRSEHDTIGTVTFTTGGGALDDCTVSGPYTNNTTRNYRVEIDGAGAPDTFKWSRDGGSTWVATLVAITGIAQSLENGISIIFGATTGHAVGDRWDFEANRISGVMTIIQSQDGSIEHADTLVANIYNNDPANAAYEVDTVLPYAKLEFVAGSRALTSFSASLNGKVS